MKPNRKVGASGLAGALVTLVVGALEMNGVSITSEMAAAGTTVAMFLVAYFVNEPEKVKP